MTLVLNTLFTPIYFSTMVINFSAQPNYNFQGECFSVDEKTGQVE
jgi:hypothetical protein